MSEYVGGWKLIVKHIFRRISVLRIERGLKQGEFADAISLSRSTLSNYEQGRREIRTDTLLKVAEFFDVNVEYLIEKTDYRQSVRSFGDIFSEVDDRRVTNGELYEMLNRLSPENRAMIIKMLDMMLGRT